jgi:hypothetical protein
VKGRALIWLTCGLVLAVAAVHAYFLETPHWSSGSSIVMQLELGSSNGTLLDGSADWGASAEGALALWNPFLKGVQFTVVRNSTAPLALSNGLNNVFWGDDIYGVPFGTGVIAYTQYLYRVSDKTFLEADVIFNRAYSWNSYRGNLRSTSGGGTLNDFQRVALHEFGHVIGLDHPDEHGQSVQAIMNAHISNLDILQLDDTNGAAAIYGVPPVSDTLASGARLLPGQTLKSTGGRYRLLYQTDGNLVLYDDQNNVALWSTATTGTRAGQALMQTDGNFVLYDATGAPQFNTATAGNPGARMVVQADGNVVIYRTDGRPVWNRIAAGH